MALATPDFRVRLRGGMQARLRVEFKTRPSPSPPSARPARAGTPPAAPRLCPGRASDQRSPVPPGAQIFIKTLTGRKQAMTLEPTDEVRTIKQSLQEKEGIQVDQIRLIYSGKQLADDKKIEFYNIQAGGTIHMVLQLRGGGPY